MEVRTKMKGKTEGEEERQRTRGGRGNVQYRIKQGRRQRNNNKKKTTGGIKIQSPRDFKYYEKLQFE